MQKKPRIQITLIFFQGLLFLLTVQIVASQTMSPQCTSKINILHKRLQNCQRSPEPRNCQCKEKLEELMATVETLLLNISDAKANEFAASVVDYVKDVKGTIATKLTVVKEGM